MITDIDIDKMLDRFKVIFVTRSEFDELKEDMLVVKENVKDLPLKLDQIAKPFSDLHDEYIAIKMQADRHDGWIKHIADKTNIKLHL